MNMSASSSRRGVWIGLGAVFIVGGLVAAVLLWSGASQRRNSAIENFARAPIGCDTTLDFIEPGEYLLFVETVGNLDGVRGDCDVEGAYDNADQGDPDVEITLVDPDGVDVDLNPSFGDVEYDAAGFRGAARFSIDIEKTDDHVLRAESEVDEVFVVAVGRDPNEGVTPLRTGAIAAGLIGLLAGLAFLLLGARKSSATVPAGPWTPGVAPQPAAFVPGGTVPQGPPVYGQQGGPPQYGQQPPPPQYGQAGQYGQAASPAYAPPGAPQYGQQYGQQQPYPEQQPNPQQQPPAPQATQPAPPQFQPNIPGQPTFPQAHADPAGSAQPIEWAPQSPAPPPPPPNPSEAAPPDADILRQPREERSTQQRPPPPPPK
jgi:hypothetical protein